MIIQEALMALQNCIKFYPEALILGLAWSRYSTENAVYKLLYRILSQK